MKLLSLLLALVISASVFSVVRFDRDVKLPFEIASSGPLLTDMETGALSPNVTNIGTSLTTIWSEGGNYVFLVAPSTLSIASDDSDDSAAGTGLRTVEVTCLDSDYNKFKEIITLNGQTPVAMTAQCFRVQGNGMTGLSAGSTGSNEGIIYIGDGAFTAGKPANVQGLIDPGDNMSRFGIYTVPANKSLLVTEFIVSSSDIRNTTVSIFARSVGGIFVRTVSFTINNSTINITRKYPQRVDAKTDIELKAITDLVDADIQILVSFLVGTGI